jgi:hypothetical protein
MRYCSSECMSVGPSIANITSSRIESASKHHLAVRVNFEHMLSWVGYDQTVLQKEKMKWCMHKDDLVVGCSRPVRQNEPSKGSVRNKAYPSVVVTLAKMERQAVNYLVSLNHNCRTFRERDEFIVNVERTMDRWVGRNGTEVCRKQIQEMPEFYFVGIGVGLAYAHPNSGDNMATAMIGGLVTIMNGAFAVLGGDMMHWYWEAERACFQSTGHRIEETIKGEHGLFPVSEDVTRFVTNNHSDPSRQEEKRRKFFDRGNGNFSSPMYDGNVTGKQQVAFPKPFRYQDNEERVADRMRVFGRALTSARPFEMVDVMVYRQSL